MGSCFEITCTLLRIAADSVIYYVYRSSFILEPQLHVQLELITNAMRSYHGGKYVGLLSKR